ncbi:MAG: DUF4403 family protein [Sphingobacteriales bacterium]|nr:MAG: DUF4403 family protein [Sphingobacteriales bacterium]
MLNPRFLVITGILILASCSKKIIPEKPAVYNTDYKLDTLPLSEIDIPIKINLKPLYDLAEKKVETVYTSDNYPNQWSYDGCDTRYMYQFKRDRLRISTKNNVIRLAFSGFYKVRGSQRVCVGNTGVSPWAPDCSCGYKEEPRRVEVGFQAVIGIHADYSVSSIIERMEPLPVDKCEVCFFKKDITKTVMDQLKLELDSAKMSIMDTLSKINLRSQFQNIWNKLNSGQNLYGLGYLKMNPEKIRISSLAADNDTISLSVGLSARPIISSVKPADTKSPIPNISDFKPHSSFNLFLDAQLDYDSLSNIITNRMKGYRMDISQVPQKYVMVESVKIYGDGKDKLILGVEFSGSNSGIMYFIGKPVYDKITGTLEIKNLDYDLKTKNLFLNTAKWLFDKKILNALNKHSKFEVANYINNLLPQLNQQLNREVYKGIFTTGKMESLQVTDLLPATGVFILRCNAKGELAMQVNSINL